MEEHEVIFSRYLKSLGLKLTNQRKIIMDQIFLTHDHFNVEDLLFKIQTIYNYVSRATIYRTLPLLINAGLIKESAKTKDKDSYEHVLGHPRHFHLICTECKRIIEVEENNSLKKFLNNVGLENDFEISDYSLSIKGKCNECSKK